MKTIEIQGKEYTTEEAHRKLWNWLADNPGKLKSCFFDEYEIETEIPSDCFACMEIDDLKGHINCNNCPVKWADEYLENCCQCMDQDTLYYFWKHSLDSDELSFSAREIAQLPWKEGGWSEEKY